MALMDADIIGTTTSRKGRKGREGLGTAEHAEYAESAHMRSRDEYPQEEVLSSAFICVICGHPPLRPSLETDRRHRVQPA
jgi:hypothetical protein